MYKISQKNIRDLSTVVIIALFSISLWQLAAAGWIQGKAIIAQQLLNHAWDKTLVDSKKTDRNKMSNQGKKSISHKPWPWADTWPVAKLIIPQHDIEQIILAGDSGGSLAFAPGHSLAGAMPNNPGTAIISAHRDTHFRFLKDVQIGETLFLQTTDKTTGYRVYDLQIVDSKTYRIQAAVDSRTLILVTCYPFDALTSGGHLRYMVYATTHTTQNHAAQQVIQTG